MTIIGQTDGDYTVKLTLASGDGLSRFISGRRGGGAQIPIVLKGTKTDPMTKSMKVTLDEDALELIKDMIEMARDKKDR